MSGTGVGIDPSTAGPRAGICDMKLEVVTLPVSDVDRAKRFYESLGWRLDADIRCTRLRATPDPRRRRRRRRARERRPLRCRGQREVFHLDGGRVPGRDPQGRSYQSYASFSDPDGNEWLLQEIRMRLPGREWQD